MTMQELKSIRIHRQRIRELDEEIETLKSEMQKITPSMSEAPCKPTGGDKRAGQIARMIELKAELTERHTLLADALDKLSTWLCILPEQQERVMYARYMQGMSWPLIARVTGYSKRHCQRIHDCAVQKCA
jgi:DNA-directed RNA polymerase specialized sigma subunit